MSAESRAVEALETMADEPTIAKAKSLVDLDRARWMYDPEEGDIIALVLNGTNTAACVVYINGGSAQDFEWNDEVECAEADEFGTCIHSDHMQARGM